MADTPEVQAEAGVPFDQDEWDAYWEEESRLDKERMAQAWKSGFSIKLGCGVPRLNPNGSLMLDENGQEMYLPGNEPTEEPDE